jgi:endothelin-converting enzyme
MKANEIPDDQARTYSITYFTIMLCNVHLSKTFLYVFTETGTFDRVADDNEAILRQIFENNFEHLQYINGNAGISENQRVKDKQIFEKAKNYYESCMDEQVINQLGMSPLEPLLENLTSIWNAHQGDKKIAITHALSYLTAIGVSPLFSFYGDADSKNPNVNTLYLQQQGLGLPTKEYYAVPATVELYKGILKDTWKLTVFSSEGAAYDPHTDINSITEKIVDFEKKLANISNST